MVDCGNLGMGISSFFGKLANYFAGWWEIKGEIAGGNAAAKSRY